MGCGGPPLAPLTVAQESNDIAADTSGDPALLPDAVSAFLWLLQ